jgi:phage anti-repressor protein
MAEIIPHQIDDKLIELLNKEFQDADFKRDFITSFQLYLIYGNEPTRFVVDLDNVWEWIGFSKKDKAKNVLVKHFIEGTDYTISSNPCTRERVHGGQNKETILMNVETFKDFCMISNTDKGKQTRRYYSKMETVFFRYLQEKHRTTIQELEEQKKALEYDNKKQKALEIQKKLLNAHKNTPLVYILKIQEDDDNNFIIKIGETDDIEQRIISLRQEYKDCVLIDAFPCQRPHGFEQYILHRKDVLKHKFVSTETIKISKDFPYSNLLKIINKNIQNFDGLTPTQKLDMALSKERALLMQLIQSADNPEQKQQFVDMLVRLDSTNIPITTKKEVVDEDTDNLEVPDRNRRVYKYSLIDLKNPIETFYSLKQAARSLDSPNVHDYHIRNASNSNTEFFGFRWYYVDGSTDIPDDIPPTVEKEKKVGHRKGLVAQISNDKKIIVNVYPSQKFAAEIHKIPLSSITTGITTRKKAHGFYWDMYDNCDEELKNSFTGVLPDAARVATCSKVVQRIDPDTDEVLEVYPCIQDVCSIYRTCHKTIHKVSNSGEIYKGYKWNITTEIKSE